VIAWGVEVLLYGDEIGGTKEEGSAGGDEDEGRVQRR
jgi:hypothetical protein